MDAKHDLNVVRIFREAWEVFAGRPFFSAGTWVVFCLFGQGVSLGDSDGSVILLLIFILLALGRGAVRGGYDLAMLRLLRGDGGVVFRDLFRGFTKFWSFLGVQMSLGIALSFVGGTMFIVWMVLPDLPGIAGQLLSGALITLGVFGALTLLVGLCFAFLLVMEDDLVTYDALTDSWSLTGGYRLKIFSTFLVGVFLEALVLGVAALAFALLSAVWATDVPASVVGGLLLLAGSMVVGSISQLALIGAYRVLRQHREGDGVVA